MGNQAYKQLHRETGLCIYCSEPVYKGYSRCLKHIRSHAVGGAKAYLNNKDRWDARSRANKERYVATGRCVECSAPLNESEKGRSCSNCNAGIVRERLIHGNPIV